MALGLALLGVDESVSAVYVFQWREMEEKSTFSLILYNEQS